MYLGTGAGGTNLGVEVLLLPRGQANGLVDRKVGLHGEGGLGQVQGRLEGLDSDMVSVVSGLVTVTSGIGSSWLTFRQGAANIYCIWADSLWYRAGIGGEVLKMQRDADGMFKEEGRDYPGGGASKETSAVRRIFVEYLRSQLALPSR